MTAEKKTGLAPGVKGSGRKAGQRSLTPAEKAEAAALWRTGETTLESLAKQFGKRPETFSRLFKDMGITKGEAAKEHQAKVTAAVETRMLQDSELLAHRIAKVKEESFKRADGIARLVWAELVKAQQAGKGFESARGSMQTLNLAAATLAKVREEQYTILRVEEHDNSVDDDDLPDLTVRELTQGEVKELQSASFDTDDMGGDLPEVLDPLAGPGGDLDD